MRLNFNDKESLQIVRDTIAADCSVHYKINQLTGIAGMGGTKLKAAFKKQYGTSLYQFCIQQKMQLARQLIQEDKKSLSQIAAATGYHYLPNFISAFKKYYGYTPGRLKPR